MSDRGHEQRASRVFALRWGCFIGILAGGWWQAHAGTSVVLIGAGIVLLVAVAGVARQAWRDVHRA